MDTVTSNHFVHDERKLKELCQLADSRNVDPNEFAAVAVDLPPDDPLNEYVEAHEQGEVDRPGRGGRGP